MEEAYLEPRALLESNDRRVKPLQEMGCKSPMYNCDTIHNLYDQTATQRSVHVVGPKHL